MSRLNAAFPRALDDNGDAVSGAFLYVYENRTTTPASIYSNPGLTTAQSNPVTSDASGEFSSVYVAAGAYTVKITDDLGVTLYEADDFIALFTNPADDLNTILNRNHSWQVQVTDLVTDIATGVQTYKPRFPQNGTLKAIRAALTVEAPVGAAFELDVLKNGVTILSTNITIDAGEQTSTAAATPPVISDDDMVGDSEMTFDVKQVGSTTAGMGLLVNLLYLPD